VWGRISLGLEEKSFKKCGISNSLDGSEDNLIWYSDDDHVSSSDDNNDNDESNGE
jgi:hypothetical protein